MLNELLDPFSNLALAEYRQKTFVDWPFKEGTCTTEQLAKAGFYMINSTVRCYYCWKEMEGWEEEDVPFIEHKTHAPYCPYINMFDSTPPDVILFSQLLLLEKGRAKALFDLQINELTKKMTKDGTIPTRNNYKRRPTRKRM